MLEGQNLFNVSIADLKGFFDNFNKDEGRKLRREIKSVTEKLTNIENITESQKRQSDISIDIWNEIESNLRQQKERTKRDLDKQKVKQSITPDQSLRDKLDAVTGDYVDLTEITQKGIMKGTLSAVGALYGSSTMALNNMNNIVEETGYNAEYLLEQFDEINKISQDMVRSGERLSGTSLGHLKTMVDVKKQYGAVQGASIETLDTIESFPFSLGLAVEEGREFLATLRGITAQGADFNASIIRSIKSMADANNIPMKYVMDDISENADFFAQRSGVGMENIAESVVYAEKLGVEMSTINSMLTGLEDVESIIESQMKMSLFTGEQINLLDSATSNFFGDTKQATEDVLEQVEKVNEETFKLPFVRKQMAEQLNVSATELNRIYETVQRMGSADASVNLGFNDEYKEFKENMNTLGFGQIKKSIQRDIWNPINNALQRNTKIVNNMMWGVKEGIEFIGDSIISPLFEAVPQLLPIATGIIGGLSAIGAGTMIEAKQLSVLSQIRNILATDTAGGGLLGSMGVKKYKGGQMMPGGGRAPKGGKYFFGSAGTAGKIMGGLTALTGGLGLVSESRKEKDQRSLANMMIQGAMTGGGIGMMTPFGLAGAGVGAGIGALGGLALHSGLAEGGVVTEPIMSPLGEGGKKEAVIPLENQSATENMKMSLSDSTIDKLAHKLSGGDNKVVIEYKANGKTYSDKEKFFKEITQ